jgi:hypothetical protein|tara:strand:- start:2956 stop:3123 length:168 start_codon:yes stop_codon:yes gene_type:complete
MAKQYDVTPVPGGRVKDLPPKAKSSKNAEKAKADAHKKYQEEMDFSNAIREEDIF